MQDHINSNLRKLYSVRSSHCMFILAYEDGVKIIADVSKGDHDRHDVTVGEFPVRLGTYYGRMF